MKVFIVKADNHDYDFMSEWYGDHAYTTEEAAEKEEKRLKEEYWKAHPGSKKQGFPNTEILEFEVT